MRVPRRELAPLVVEPVPVRAALKVIRVVPGDAGRVRPVAERGVEGRVVLPIAVSANGPAEDGSGDNVGRWGRDVSWGGGRSRAREQRTVVPVVHRPGDGDEPGIKERGQLSRTARKSDVEAAHVQANSGARRIQLLADMPFLS